MKCASCGLEFANSTTLMYHVGTVHDRQNDGHGDGTKINEGILEQIRMESEGDGAERNERILEHIRMEPEGDETESDEGILEHIRMETEGDSRSDEMSQGQAFNIPVEKMKCDLCGLEFANTTTFMYHLALVHGDSRPKRQPRRSDEMSQDEAFLCLGCGKRYGNAIGLNLHTRECQKNESTEPRNVFQGSSSKKTSANLRADSVMDSGLTDSFGLKKTSTRSGSLDQGGAIGCPLCKMQCVSSIGLTSHMRNCQKQRTFIPIETAEGSSRSKKRPRRYSEMEIENPIQCPICKKVCSSDSGLSLHMKKCAAIDHVSKPLQCTRCQKQCTSRSGLTLHMKKCTTEALFNFPKRPRSSRDIITPETAAGVLLRLKTDDRPILMKKGDVAVAAADESGSANDADVEGSTHSDRNDDADDAESTRESKDA